MNKLQLCCHFFYTIVFIKFSTIPSMSSIKSERKFISINPANDTWNHFSTINEDNYIFLENANCTQDIVFGLAICFVRFSRLWDADTWITVLIFYLLVCDDHAFKDQMLFYRFRRDDGSRGYDKEVQLVFQAIDIYNR